MGKSEQLFHGYCETLREMLDKMSDEEFGKFNANARNRELINYIGYQRRLRHDKQVDAVAE